MAAFGAKLKPRQMRALIALTTGAEVAEAAVSAKCSAGAIYGWLKDPVFRAEYDRALERQRDITQGFMFRRIQSAGEAIDRGLVATKDGQPDHGPQLRAAELVVRAVEAFSKRADDAQAPATGPLIILPGGAQPVALLIGGNGQPRLEAGQDQRQDRQDQQVIDAQAVSVPPAEPPPSLPPGGPSLERLDPAAPQRVPDGLPSWWQAVQSKFK
jgi:hypothetical protein